MDRGVHFSYTEVLTLLGPVTDWLTRQKINGKTNYTVLDEPPADLWLTERPRTSGEESREGPLSLLTPASEPGCTGKGEARGPGGKSAGKTVKAALIFNQSLVLEASEMTNH